MHQSPQLEISSGEVPPSSSEDCNWPPPSSAGDSNWTPFEAPTTPRAASKDYTPPGLAMRWLRMALVFLFLELLLWSVLLRPSVEIDVRWVPHTFFTSARKTTCLVRMHRGPMVHLEMSFFSALAMLGYFRGCGGTAAIGRAIYGRSLATFEQAMMGAQQKYYWMCLVPWLVTFAQNWLRNVGEFMLLLFSADDDGSEVYKAQNLYSTIALMVTYFSVQAAMASEVLYMTLQGWYALRNISDENVEWERQKGFFNGILKNTFTGLME